MENADIIALNVDSPSRVFVVLVLVLSLLDVDCGGTLLTCSSPVLSTKLTPAACSVFPVPFECENHTRLIPCTCPAFIPAADQKLFSFYPTEVTGLTKNFQQWGFPTDHRLYSTFPIDPLRTNAVRQVQHAVFSVVYPIPFRSGSRRAAVSDVALTDLLDLAPSVASSADFVRFVSGQADWERAMPLSHRYGGHQFGYWAGQLGDGRAVMLGEYVNRKGQRWELQLKGSGLTPYSRQGDGRAVIRSSVREFLCSEAMYHLGIPTSRAASIVVSNDTIVRDQFYDGHPRHEKTAIVLRLARSWFRIGSLEILTISGETELLKQVVDFIIAEYFSVIDTSDDGKYLAFFQEVVRETAFLMAMWQSVGFAHGVCNTDNFSLLSITIDYGPFGFLDAYDPKFVPNTSDDEHRYSYENQPDVGAFNLEKLRQALFPLWSQAERSVSQDILLSYGDHFRSRFMEIFRTKLGLTANQGDEDEHLVAVLLRIMSDTKADFTMTFRELSEIDLTELKDKRIDSKFWALNAVVTHKWFSGWVKMYVKRLKAEGQTDTKRQEIMQKTNPRYILRNWIAQLAVEKTEKNDFSVLTELYHIFRNPFQYQERAERMGLADPPPAWASGLKVSCSS